MPSLGYMELSGEDMQCFIKECHQLERSQGQNPGRNTLRMLASLPPMYSRISLGEPKWKSDVEEAHWPEPDKQTEVWEKK